MNKVNIEVKKGMAEVTVSELGDGEVFLFIDNYYMRITTGGFNIELQPNVVTCLSIADAELVCIKNDCIVKPVEAKVVIS